MPHLRPCPQCSRHVRADEPRCPFCDSAIDADNSGPAAPATRLGRAAMMAFGTAIVATAATAAASCGGAQSGDAQNSGSGNATTEQSDAGPQEPPEDPRRRRGNPDDGPGNQAMPYGAPPADGLLQVV